MANLRYPLSAQLALSLICGVGTRPTYANGLMGCLVDLADYTYSAAHEFLSDIPSGARVGTPQAIGNLSFTNGVLDGDDIEFPTVTGDPCEAMAIWGDTGTEGTSRLLYLIDTATGLPITPGGGNIPVAFHASGIASHP